MANDATAPHHVIVSVAGMPARYPDKSRPLARARGNPISAPISGDRQQQVAPEAADAETYVLEERVHLVPECGAVKRHATPPR